MVEWTDPRPKLPEAEFRVLVRCDDGSVRYARFNRYEGWTTRDGFHWSMAHPNIVAWKQASWPPATDEERAAFHYPKNNGLPEDACGVPVPVQETK